MERVIETSFVELLKSGGVRLQLSAYLSKLVALLGIRSEIKLKNPEAQIWSHRFEQTGRFAVFACASYESVGDGAARHGPQFSGYQFYWLQPGRSEILPELSMFRGFLFVKLLSIMSLGDEAGGCPVIDAMDLIQIVDARLAKLRVS